MKDVQIGDVVLVRLHHGEDRPALVVRVWENEFMQNPHGVTTGLNLQLFIDGTNDYNALIVQPSPTDEERARIIAICARGSMWLTSAEYATATDDSPWSWRPVGER